MPRDTYRITADGSGERRRGLRCRARVWLAHTGTGGSCGGAGATTFVAIFYAGVRWVVFRDPDTLRLAYRIAGHRLRVFNRLLPALPVSPE